MTEKKPHSSENMERRLINQVKSFEKLIDENLASLSCLNYNGDDCILFSSFIIEAAYAQGNYPLATNLEHGFEILLPFFITIEKKGKIPSIEVVFEALSFASHYYALRNFLYYTYNLPNVIKWEFSPNRIIITYEDITIPKQIFIDINKWLVYSMEIFSDYNGKNEILLLLKDIEEFERSEKQNKACQIINEEVKLKMKNYYNFISDDVQLGKYSFQQFVSIYNSLMLKALYHRYYAEANSVGVPIVFLPKKDYINELSDINAIPREICQEIVNDMTYSEANADINPENLPLLYLKEKKEYILRPYTFGLSSGFLNLLRIWATRNPSVFGKLTKQLDKNFVMFVSNLFEKQGFFTKANISLQKANQGLPDIDLIVISKEPGMLFVVFICELKNPLPQQWAKGELRTIGKEGHIIKALDQITKIKNFLKTEYGKQLILNLIIEGYGDFKSDFKEGLVIVYNFLIITSQNTGIFFVENETSIIDYVSLQMTLDKCDGDIYYVLSMLKDFSTYLKKCFEVTETCFYLQDKEICYEGVKIKQLLGFGQNKYRSIGIDKKFLDEAKKDGYSFIKTLINGNEEE